MRYRSVLPGLLTLFAFGCGEGSTAPDGAVTGTWGGQGVQLIARPGSLRVQLSCAFSVTREALVPDASGRFVMSIEPLDRQSAAAATLRGTIDGSQISFEIITVTVDATHTAHFTVVRDQAPSFGFCALE